MYRLLALLTLLTAALGVQANTIYTCTQGQGPANALCSVRCGDNNSGHEDDWKRSSCYDTCRTANNGIPCTVSAPTQTGTIRVAPNSNGDGPIKKRIGPK
jgi:hypothetical protein